MSVVTMVLWFLLAVVASVFLSRLLPWKVPLPILQIAMGSLLSLFGFEVEFEPHLFLLLFIPPLLFLDGWRIPKDALFNDWKPIMSLAIGLVVVTVIGIGLLIHWLLPAIPIAVAFALAAILSPTDPVSVSAMTVNSPLPSRMAHVLEGESLLNDATGLVCFSFAVTAALTGTFSLADAAVGFLSVASGGVIAGLAVTWIIGQLNRFLIKRTGEEPAIQILISLLIPFTAYLVAENLHVSGILAAVVAGIAMHYDELSGRTQVVTRMQRIAVWDTVQVTLNGIIFILLGEQLPRMWQTMPDVADSAGASSNWILLGFVVAITLALGTLRFLWVWISISLTVFRGRRKGQDRTMPRTRIMAVMATAGVRGSITLAGILTLPLFLPDGTDFPGRDVAIFLAMGVILLSLLIASVGLPVLTRGLNIDLPHTDHEAGARVVLTEAALNRIKEIIAQPAAKLDETAFRTEAGSRLLKIYNYRLGYGVDDGDQGSLPDRVKLAEVEHQLYREALRAERDELYKLRKTKSINDEVYRRLLREIDLKEESINFR